MHLGVGSFPDRLRVWHRLLPFVGQSWDVTYFPWNSAAIDYFPLFDLGPPAVVSCRGSQVNVAPHDPGRQYLREELSLTFRKAAAVHCVSESINLQASLYGLEASKARVIHPAVDPNFFRPGERAKSANETFDIVTTGSLNWVKGYEYALLAVRLLLDQGIPAHFHIIGGGPDYSRLLYTIGDLNLEGNVHLYGRLAPLEVRHRLQEADAFLLSSLSEGICNSVLEAMACGLPVVTTECGGMREAVSDGVEGFVVPVRDPEAIAAALARLAADTELARQLGQAARQRILKDFTLKRQVEKFIELFRDVVRNA
jgi:colanic acid/amylovoran biosynthesis glycosyltransferase